MKNEEIVVIKQSLDLLETMEEGIFYIEDRLVEEKSESAINLLLDLVHAFASIEQAINPIQGKLKENSIDIKTEIFKSSLDAMVKEYEIKQGKDGVNIMQSKLKPDFLSWKKELEITIRPYVLS